MLLLLFYADVVLFLVSGSGIAASM